MLRLCRVDIGRSEEVLQRLGLYVKGLVESLDPRLVILFGSFAREDVNEGSDVDLAVVADFKESFLDRMKLLTDLNKYHIPLEPVGYTPEEFEGMRERNNPFIMEVLRTGKILYEKAIEAR